MPLDPKHIGREFPPFTIAVERGKIREFVRALGDDNSIFLDDDEARAAGLPGVVAPLTFATVLTHWGGGESRELVEAIGGDYARLVHGEQEYEYRRPLRPGDVITGRTRVVDIETKQGKSGPLEVLTFETTFTDAAGELVIIGRSTAVIRG